MNILITSAGRRVSLIRAFQQELKKYFPESKVFASDSDPKLSAGCQVADGFFEVPRLNKRQYIASLIDICKKNDIALIIPTIDTELSQLSKNVDLFKSEGIDILVSNTKFVKKCRDKRAIHKFFKNNNINIAQEYSKENYKLPLFIKPIDGSRSVDTYIIKTKEDLKEYHFNNDKLMFLEYLDHSNYEEYTCDLYYAKDNQLKCAVPRKRLEVRDGEVYKAVTKKNALLDFIKENLSYVKGAKGCLTAQFFVSKIDETEIYGIEINPRFGGGFPLSYLAGANFPGWIIEEYMLNKPIDSKFNVWEADLLMIRYDDEVLVHGYKD